MSREERFESRTMEIKEREEEFRNSDTEPYARPFSLDDYHGIRDTVEEFQSSMNY